MYHLTTEMYTYFDIVSLKWRKKLYLCKLIVFYIFFFDWLQEWVIRWSTNTSDVRWERGTRTCSRRRHRRRRHRWRRPILLVRIRLAMISSLRRLMLPACQVTPEAHSATLYFSRNNYSNGNKVTVSSSINSRFGCHTISSTFFFFNFYSIQFFIIFL